MKNRGHQNRQKFGVSVIYIFWGRRPRKFRGWKALRGVGKCPCDVLLRCCGPCCALTESWKSGCVLTESVFTHRTVVFLNFSSYRVAIALREANYSVGLPSRLLLENKFHMSNALMESLYKGMHRTFRRGRNPSCS